MRGLFKLGLSIRVAVAFATFVVIACSDIRAVSHTSCRAAAARFGHVIGDAEGGRMFTAIGLLVVVVKGFAGRKVSNFGITSEISDQNYFVDAGHNCCALKCGPR